jgi:hypothetical protein
LPLRKAWRAVPLARPHRKQRNRCIETPIVRGPLTLTLARRSAHNRQRDEVSNQYAETHPLTSMCHHRSQHSFIKQRKSGPPHSSPYTTQLSTSVVHPSLPYHHFTYDNYETKPSL